jgi:hypothetical protein
VIEAHQPYWGMSVSAAPAAAPAFLFSASGRRHLADQIEYFGDVAYLT